MASRGRRAQRTQRGRREGATPPAPPEATTPRTTSRVEIAGYGILAGAVAAAVLVAANRPWWIAIAVLAGSAALVLVVVLTVGNEGDRGRRRKR